MRRWAAFVIVAMGLIVPACATSPPSPYSDDATPVVALETVEDRRGRFREIFCAVLDQRGHEFPDYRPCDEALTRLGVEPDESGKRVDLGASNRRLVAMIVPGVGWNCIANWLDLQESTADYVRRFGYDVSLVDIESLSSSEANARQIRDSVMAMEHAGIECQAPFFQQIIEP